MFLESFSPQEGLQYYGESTNAESYRNLGLCYRNGELGVVVNHSQAYDYFVVAIELGSVKALADVEVEVRAAFNNLLKTQPAIFLNLCLELGDTIESLQSLIDLSSEERVSFGAYIPSISVIAPRIYC